MPAWLLATWLPAAPAMDLLQAWDAAQTHDRSLASARAAHAVAAPQRRQANALWRPTVALVAGAGQGYGTSTMQGAQFTAPGMGTQRDVDFATSVTHGHSQQLALQASQPIYNRARSAAREQLQLGATRADVQWQQAEQAAMLRIAQWYLDAALAAQTSAALSQQLAAATQAAEQAQAAFDVGAAPITAVHEAQAQQAQLQAQLFVAQTAQTVQQQRLHDATGIPPAQQQTRLAASSPQALEPLAHWQALAAADNLQLRLQALGLAAAQADAAQYRASAAPTVELVAQAQQQRLQGRGDFAHNALQKNTQGFVGVQVTVPLYTGGWRSAKAEEGIAHVHTAQAERDALQEQIAQQVQAAWLGVRTGAQQVQALQAAVTASAARQDATRIGHQAGERTMLDVLRADNDATTNLLALAAARNQLLLQHLELAQLTGQLNAQVLAQANQHLAAPALPQAVEKP